MFVEMHYLKQMPRYILPDGKRNKCYAKRVLRAYRVVARNHNRYVQYNALYKTTLLGIKNVQLQLHVVVKNENNKICDVIWENMPDVESKRVGSYPTPRVLTIDHLSHLRV